MSLLEDLFGVRVTSYRGVPCVVVRRGLIKHAMRGCSGAYMFGVMFFRGERAFRDTNTKRHEYRHHQQAVSDCLFIPKYIAEMCLNGYEDNYYERDARRYASSSRFRLRSRK